MTRLTLLRHAKSSWEHGGLHDFERPLNGRGLRDAPLMGRICSTRFPPPQMALVSPARRTRDTLSLFIEAWKGAAPEILALEGLYLAGREDWIREVRERSADCDHLLICGHQPGLGDLAAWLIRGFPADVPTAAVVSISPVDGRLGKGGGTADFFGRPGDFRD